MDDKTTNYVSVRVSTLRGDQKLSFDLYIQIGDRHILYVRQGDSFAGERLLRLQQKKLRKMFILPEHEEKYREYLTRNIEQAYDKTSSQTLENRAQVIQGLQQASTEAVFENPADAESYKQAKEGAERFADFLMREDKALKSLLSVANADQSLSHHGVTVSSLALTVAKKVGYSDPKNLSLLTLGALLHDIEHHRSGLPVAQVLGNLTPEQKEIYLAHPKAGSDLIKDLNHIDKQVAVIILEHEELIDGSGFPGKKLEKDLNPMSVLVSTANAYDRMVSFEGMTPSAAIKSLMIDKLGLHPLGQLNALKAIVSENKL
ncbi:MAG: HD domain-containing protein [Bdellovibrionaceae bacterium]|nr:HD domain-containing protein [Pseudobdellovibrionaceae bacterium]